MVQVKGIQASKSKNWNVSRSTLGKGLIFVFVNLHVDTYDAPEFFVMTDEELQSELSYHDSYRDYISYSKMKRLDVQNAWSKVANS